MVVNTSEPRPDSGRGLRWMTSATPRHFHRGHSAELRLRVGLASGAICERTYVVRPVLDQESGDITAWTMTRADGIEYLIQFGAETCNCAARTRGRAPSCKHIDGLRAALASIGMDLR